MGIKPMGGQAIPFLEAITPQTEDPSDRQTDETLDQAQQLVAAAEAEASRIRATAHREGYSAGLAEAQGQFHPLISRLGAVIEEAEQLLISREDRIAKMTVSLAQEIASIAVNRHLRLDDQAVIDAVRAALARAREEGRLVVHVAPSAIDVIEEARASLGGDGKVFTVIADETVEPGGCRLVTSSGEIDAQPSVQLARLAETIERVLSKEE